jgi:hypothetical protein
MKQLDWDCDGGVVVWRILHRNHQTGRKPEGMSGPVQFERPHQRLFREHHRPVLRPQLRQIPRGFVSERRHTIRERGDLGAAKISENESVQLATSSLIRVVVVCETSGTKHFCEKGTHVSMGGDIVQLVHKVARTPGKMRTDFRWY